jgi:hypothetical protein
MHLYLKILVSLDCYNIIPLVWRLTNNKFISRSYGRWEVDQGTSKLRIWWGTTSWLIDGIFSLYCHMEKQENEIPWLILSVLIPLHKGCALMSYDWITFQTPHFMLAPLWWLSFSLEINLENRQIFRLWNSKIIYLFL